MTLKCNNAYYKKMSQNESMMLKWSMRMMLRTKLSDKNGTNDIIWGEKEQEINWYMYSKKYDNDPYLNQPEQTPNPMTPSECLDHPPTEHPPKTHKKSVKWRVMISTR